MKRIPLILSERPDVLACRPATTHPGDHYLWVVLRSIDMRDTEHYATHVFNETLGNGSGGLVSGNYFQEDRDKAFLDFCNRQVPQTLWSVIRRRGNPEDYRVYLYRSQEVAEHTAERLAQEAGMSETDFADRSWNAEDDVEVVIREVRL